MFKPVFEKKNLENLIYFCCSYSIKCAFMQIHVKLAVQETKYDSASYSKIPFTKQICLK